MQSSDSYPDDALVAATPGARLIGVHPDTLRRYADDGRVPVVRTPSGQRRFLVRDLRALLVPEVPETTDVPATKAS